MGFKVNFDTGRLKQKMKKSNAEAISILSQQILKDSNYYAKHDSGLLIASSLLNSDFKNGRLIWSTPYAKKQYYLETTSKDVNPNARPMWFLYAKSVKIKTWVTMFDKLIRKGFKR